MSKHHQTRTPAGTPAGGQFTASERDEADVSLTPPPETPKWTMPPPNPNWVPEPTTAELFAAATDPAARDRLLQREFEETPSTMLNVVTLVDELSFDRPDPWKYDEEDSTYGYHVGEVEVLGERRWFVWQNMGWEVTDVQLCESREDAEATWRWECASHGDVYFDDWEYEDDPDMEPRTPEQIEARVDRQWVFFARATGLPEDVSREMMKARVDAKVMAEITGGKPDLSQLAAYRMLAALRS